MPADWTRPAARQPMPRVDGDLFRPVEFLAKLFEGPEGGMSGVEHVLERLEWKETMR